MMALGECQVQITGSQWAARFHWFLGAFQEQVAAASLTRTDEATVPHLGLGITG